MTIPTTTPDVAAATLTYEDLLEICAPVHAGGANALTRTDQLVPSAGPGTPVNAAKYPAAKDGEPSVNNYVTRVVNGEPVRAVTLLSKQAMLNRLEAAITAAPDDSALNLIPRIGVTYPKPGAPHEQRLLTNLDHPHRSVDSHIIAGIDPDTNRLASMHPVIKAIRAIAGTNFRPLLESAPTDLLLGLWDSFNKGGGQTRIPSAITGETIGVVADQDIEKHVPRVAAMRADALGAGLEEIKEEDFRLISAAKQGAEDPHATRDAVMANKKRPAIAKKDAKPSNLGLGSVPSSPVSADSAVDVIAVDTITATWTLSLNALRQQHYGFEPASAEAAETTVRAALLAVALTAQAYRDTDGYLRAGTDLIIESTSNYHVRTSLRPDRVFAIPTIDEAEALLHTAVEALASLGIKWAGQQLVFTGNPAIRPAATITAVPEPEQDEN